MAPSALSIQEKRNRIRSFFFLGSISDERNQRRGRSHFQTASRSRLRKRPCVEIPRIPTRKNRTEIKMAAKARRVQPEIKRKTIIDNRPIVHRRSVPHSKREGVMAFCFPLFFRFLFDIKVEEDVENMQQ